MLLMHIHPPSSNKKSFANCIIMQAPKTNFQTPPNHLHIDNIFQKSICSSVLQVRAEELGCVGLYIMGGPIAGGTISPTQILARISSK